MKKSLLVTALIFTFPWLILAWLAWSKAQDSAVLSCVASLHQAIVDSSRKESATPLEVALEWKVLSADESHRLILSTTRGRSFDCGERDSQGLPVDPWGNQFRVAVRQSAESDKLEFRLWSNGRDEIPGTADDLVSPYGERAPVPNRLTPPRHGCK